MTGTIEHGKELGRRLGFPTANIHPDGDVPFDNGVYAAAIWLGDEPRPRPCMINQGRHPTAPEGKPTVEAHILDYQGDLYGKKVRPSNPSSPATDRPPAPARTRRASSGCDAENTSDNALSVSFPDREGVAPYPD